MKPDHQPVKSDAKKISGRFCIGPVPISLPTSDVFPRNYLISLMSDSRGALHLPFRSDVWILSQTVVCFSLWFDRFCASVPAASGRECRFKSGHAFQNAFCVGSDGVWHGIAFACALTAKDRDLHSVQFVGQFQHARRVRFLGREASGYDWRSSPQKAGQNYPRKLGAAKSMISTRFQ